MERPNPDSHQAPLFHVRLWERDRGLWGAHCTTCGRRKGFSDYDRAEKWACDHVCYEDDK